MKYYGFSAYWVLDEVKKGNTVYVLDREARAVCDINSLPLDRAMAIIKNAENDCDRYEFWHEVEEETESDDGKL